MRRLLIGVVFCFVVICGVASASRPATEEERVAVADGLGVPVVRALNQVNTALGFESGFIIVIVAIVLDRMLRIRQE